MNKKIILLTVALLTAAPISTFAADCGDLSSATELASVCPPTATVGDPAVVCNLADNTTFKISQTTGSIASPLLPITLPAKSALCIANSELSGDINIVLRAILVNGVFQIGSQNSPISSANKVTITMAGSDSASMAPQPICAKTAKPKTRCSAIAYTTINTQNARDITVMGSGKLLMYGAKGLTPYLNPVSNKSDVIHSINYASGTVDGTAMAPTTGDINQFPYFNNTSGSNSWTYLNQPAGPAYYSAALNVQDPIALSNYPGKLGRIAPTAADLPYLLSLSRNIAAGDGHDWQAGDWVSISTTTFVPHETEIVQICKVYTITNPDTQDIARTPTSSIAVLAGAPSFSGQCPSIANNTPLKHYHYGSLAPTAGFFAVDQNNYKHKYSAKAGQAKSFYDGIDRNFGIDERAEVALLSRNIKLTSTAGTASVDPIANISDQYFGGHIAIMNGQHGSTPSASVALVGVEIEKFGQPLVGRYPVHFHRLNASSHTADSNGLLVQDTSVHHSFNKCFVTHDTMSVKFYNNSCVRTIGQGFYLEDGHNIADNQFIRNLVAGTMAASLNYDITATGVYNPGNTKIGENTYWDGDYLATTNFGYNPAKIPDTSDSGANTGNYIDSFEPSGFWITTFGSHINGIDYPNVFVNNSVAGCQLRGAAYWSILQNVKSFSDVPSTAKPTLYPVFSGNRGHACYDGFIAGDNSMVQANPSVAIGPQPLPVPVGQQVNNHANTPLVIFDNLNFTQIEHKAFWYRGVFVGVNNSRFAALKQGMTLLGGGGPEGNLLGFWGLVHNSVYAGVTNNNVGRYSDCEGYYKTYSSAPALTNAQALPLSTINEMVKCVPIDLSAVSTVTNIVANNTSLFGDIYPNFNFQGYTFYDGPARMESNRFINFRADVTNPAVFDNGSNGYSSSETRNLVTTIDAHRMMNYNKASQLSTAAVNGSFTPGGNQHYGAMGDAAFSWLKGNAQSVPPTQYAKGNLWENVNFKHQIFTKIANLSAGLQDGDKQTVEIDRDATLSGYKVCESHNASVCSDNGLNHFPISLNNLNIFATRSTIDEPHSQGRNNVVSSALMSPNKFATVNLEVSKSGAITDLIVSRDMPAYASETASTTYTGRGGLSYVYESMSMNNMGYTYRSKNLNNQTNFLFSFSDAPVDTTFINRVGFNIGKNASAIQVSKSARQWNSGQNYLAKSPYWTGYGLTDTNSSCPSVLTNSNNAYTDCRTSGTALSAYTDFNTLNNQFFNVLKNNYTATATPVSDFTEGFYYDASSGILYFNMVQFAQSTPPSPAITPPFGTCDSAAYNLPKGAGKKQQLIDYLKFSDATSIGRILDVGCYAPSGTPKTSELLTCPTQGCAVYTVGFTIGTGSTSQSSSLAPQATPTIVDGGTAIPTLSTSGVITYGSPYTLYDASTNTALNPVSGTVKVNNNLIRSYNYAAPSSSSSSSGAAKKAVKQTRSKASTAEPLLPMPPLPPTENGKKYALNTAPDGITIINYGLPTTGTIWTFDTGASSSAGQNASIQSSGSSKFVELPPSEKTKKRISITPDATGNVATFRYSGTTATVTIAGSANCTITFTSTTVSKGSDPGCKQLTASGTTMTVSAAQ